MNDLACFALQEPVDGGSQGGVGDGADDGLLPLALAEDEDGGDAPDAVPRCHLLVLVGVHPQATEPAGIGLGQVCDDGVHQAAGAAPRRPELDQHRRLAPEHGLVPCLLPYIAHCKCKQQMQTFVVTQAIETD